MTVIAEPTTLSPEQRSAALEKYVASAAHSGWRVQSQTSTQAQLVKGKPTSHLLHLVLTIITLGVWAIVWIAVAIFGGQKQRLVTVDEHGKIHKS